MEKNHKFDPFDLLVLKNKIKKKSYSVGECIEMKPVTNLGYPFITYKNKLYHAHRVVYMIEKGPIHQEDVVIKKCKNKRCINIEHMTLMKNKFHLLKQIKNKKNLINLTYYKKKRILFYKNLGYKHKEIGEKLNISKKIVDNVIACDRQKKNKILNCM